MTTYLAGPMTGIPEWNEPAFRKAAASLRARGFEVVSPPELDHEEGVKVGSKTHAEYMRRDIMRLLQCCQVAVLPGWEDSPGASLEVAIARAVGMPVGDAATLEEIMPTKFDSVDVMHKNVDLVEEVTVSRGVSQSKPNLAAEATALVDGDRQADYGDPLDNWTRTAALWEPILNCRVTPHQAVLCMIQVKVARECHRHKYDNLTDMAGYAIVAGKVANVAGKSGGNGHTTAKHSEISDAVLKTGTVGFP